MVCAFHNISYADNSLGSYIKIAANGNIPETVKDNKKQYEGEKSFGGALAFGYGITSNIGIEAAIDYIHNNEYNISLINNSSDVGVNAKMSIISPMINAYFNMRLTDNISGYVGVGAGASMISGGFHAKKSIKSEVKFENKTNFAGKAMVGLIMDMNPISLDVGYNFGYYGDVEKISLKIHTASVGIRYNF